MFGIRVCPADVPFPFLHVFSHVLVFCFIGVFFYIVLFFFPTVVLILCAAMLFRVAALDLGLILPTSSSAIWMVFIGTQENRGALVGAHGCVQ